MAVPKTSGGRDCERGAWGLGMSVSVGERTGTRRRIEREKDEVSYDGRGLRDGYLYLSSSSSSIRESSWRSSLKPQASKHWLVTWCGQWDGGITFFMKYWWGRRRGRGIGTGVPAHSQQIKNKLIILVQAIRKKQGRLCRAVEDDARYFRERTLKTCGWKANQDYGLVRWMPCGVRGR